MSKTLGTRKEHLNSDEGGRTMSKALGMRWLVVAAGAAMLLVLGAACTKEVEVPGETVIVEKEVVKTVEVPGETIVVEKEVVKTVEVEVPGKTVTVTKEVIKEVEVPGETVVVTKEVIKEVEVPGKTVVVTKEVLKVVEVRQGYVTDPTTGKVVLKPQYGGTLTFVSKLSPPTCDPLFHPWATFACIGGVIEKLGMVNWGIDRNEYDIRKPAFRPLFAYTGQLAESWSQPDPLTIIFNIRKGVNWHNKAPMNGRELTAKDVEYNLHRAFGIGSGFTAENKPPVLYGDAFVNLPVESITATDKWTVVIKLKQPSLGSLLQFLDHTATFIMPPEVIEQYGDVQDWSNVVGTGPFELTDYVEDSSLTLIKNPDYWGFDEKYPENRLPYIDQLTVLIMQEEVTYIAALRSAKIDFFGWPGVADIKSMDQVDSLRRTNPEILQWPFVFRSNTGYVIETTKPPLSDIRVRKAMQMALDHETINNVFYNGYGLWKPQGPIGDGIVGYNTPFEEWPEELQKEYTYDPQGAEKLLDDAGYPRGADGIRFKTDVVHSRVHLPVDYTELAVGYWAEIGIQVTIDAVDAATYGARVSAGHDFEGLAWSSTGKEYADVVGVLRKYSVQGGHQQGGTDPTYEALFEAAAAAKTIEELQRAAKEANMYVIENHWHIWGSIVPQVTASWPWVKGYNGEISTYFSMAARLWIDQDLKKAMGH